MAVFRWRMGIYGGCSQCRHGGYLPPCGICRQVLTEFYDMETFQVILANHEQDYRIMTLAQLLPGAFQSKT